jgi:hypothetical protein
MALTPRETFAWARVIRNRLSQQNADNLVAAWLGARGPGEDLEKQLKAWGGE